MQLKYTKRPFKKTLDRLIALVILDPLKFLVFATPANRCSPSLDEDTSGGASLSLSSVSTLAKAPREEV